MTRTGEDLFEITAASGPPTASFTGAPASGPALLVHGDHRRGRIARLPVCWTGTPTEADSVSTADPDREDLDTLTESAPPGGPSCFYRIGVRIPWFIQIDAPPPRVQLSKSLSPLGVLIFSV